MAKWTKLSQDNKVKLMIVILGAVFSVVGYFGKSWFDNIKSFPGSSQEIVIQTLSDDNIFVEKVLQLGAKSAIPNISGKWSGKDGVLTIIEHFSDGTLAIESSSYGKGNGEAIPKMPSKFRVFFPRKGEGEYTVSSDGLTMMSRFSKKASTQAEYDTLRKTE